jgi:hypothetical protein
MTGKRPRALTRTASVSQLGSAGNLSQEFSPLLENPKEKLKPTTKESPPACAPRVVIGFDPKPSAHGLDMGECGVASPKSAPCSPSFQDRTSSPRSVLNSLFSRQRGKAAAAMTEGVGLGIVLHAPTPAAEDIKISIPAEADHVAIPVRDETSPLRPREIPVAQPRRHSHPIPISPCHFSQQCVQTTKQATSASDRPVARPVLGWLEQDVLKVDRRDTFLLAPSPARSLVGDNVAAALTASSHFLDECSFCKRHLPKDKDIFMYR